MHVAATAASRTTGVRTPGATTTASIAGRARSGIVRVGLTGPGHHGNHQPEPSPNAERAPSAVQATTTETATVVVSPRRGGRVATTATQQTAHQIVTDSAHRAELPRSSASVSGGHVPS